MSNLNFLWIFAGKNGSGRHHLPYVVSAPPENSDAPAAAAPQATPAVDEAKDDRGAGSGEEGCGSSGSGGSGQATGPTTGTGTGRGHQRVLRSHR